MEIFNIYEPCNGTNERNMSIPKNADTPISRHKKYETKITPNGPIHKKCKNFIAMSNLFTSFDIKFATCPMVVSPSADLLNRCA